MVKVFQLARCAGKGLVKDAAWDSWIAQRDDMHIAAGARAFDSLPHLHAETRRFVHDDQDVLAMKALEAHRLVGREADRVTPVSQSHFGLIGREEREDAVGGRL